MANVLSTAKRVAGDPEPRHISTRARYNLCRIHKTLRVTPAMAAGVESRAWEIADLVALLPKAEGKPRGSYKKRAADPGISK